MSHFGLEFGSIYANANANVCLLNKTKVIKQISLDFDGDGNKDLLRLVEIVDACIINNAISPWYGRYQVDSAVFERTKVLFVDNRSNGQVIFDSENPSILNTPSANELMMIHKSDAIKLHRELEKSRGDILIVPTESGIDSYLYWNGMKYQTLFPNEEP